jgi:hypothetical protein
MEASEATYSAPGLEIFLKNGSLQLRGRIFGLPSRIVWPTIASLSWDISMVYQSHGLNQCPSIKQLLWLDGQPKPSELTVCA